ncbi:hypothetical protein BJY52DRAFT_912695 [Lactarius psammicola]|nr:hypothetical protein BJY52DRAFT_912695 [Lactarius psammicola]
MVSITFQLVYSHGSQYIQRASHSRTDFPSLVWRCYGHVPSLLGHEFPLHCIPQQLNRTTTHRAGTGIKLAPSSPGLSPLSTLSMGTQSRSPTSLPSFAELILSMRSPSIHPFSLPGGPSSGVTPHTRAITQDRRKKRRNVQAQGKNYKHATTISMLPDNVLLEIFDFYRTNRDYLIRAGWEWHLLVHVCQRWRQIIFASPNRLNLQIICTYGTPVRKSLGIWPAIPIGIDFCYSDIPPTDEDNVIAALEHSDRVCFVSLGVTGSQLGNMATVMQEPFPVLAHIKIESKDRNAPVPFRRILGRVCTVFTANLFKRHSPFQHYQRFFCRPVTSSGSLFSKYPRLVTFHPRRWLRLWRHCPDSKSLSLGSNRLLPALVEYLHPP